MDTKRIQINDKISLEVASDWNVLDEAQLEAKFPGQQEKPMIAMGNGDLGSTVICYLRGSSVSNEHLEDYAAQLLEGFSQAEGFQLNEDKIIKINEYDFGMIDSVVQAIDERIRIITVFSAVDSKLLICSFSVTESQWRDGFPQVISGVQSIVVTE